MRSIMYPHPPSPIFEHDDELALDLDPVDADRHEDLQQLFSTSHRHRRRNIQRPSGHTPATIRRVIALLIKGVPQSHIASRLKIARKVVEEVAIGRRNESGRIGDDLEIWQKRLKTPIRCAACESAGIFTRIDIVPCRACAARRMRGIMSQ